MYYNDHAAPHFHAIYGDQEAKVSIMEGRLMEGWLQPRARRLVEEWATMHLPELMVAWERAREGLPLGTIEPLP